MWIGEFSYINSSLSTSYLKEFLYSTARPLGGCCGEQHISWQSVGKIVSIFSGNEIPLGFRWFIFDLFLMMKGLWQRSLCWHNIWAATKCHWNAKTRWSNSTHHLGKLARYTWVGRYDLNAPLSPDILAATYWNLEMAIRCTSAIRCPNKQQRATDMRCSPLDN